MLKLTYTENGLYLESLSQPLESWVQTRVLLALRSATPIWLEPTTAAFLVSSNLPYLGDLLDIIQENPDGNLSLSLVDEDEVEINLEGTWLSSDAESSEGVFVAVVSDRAESIIHDLWQASQTSAGVMLE